MRNMSLLITIDDDDDDAADADVDRGIYQLLWKVSDISMLITVEGYFNFYEKWVIFQCW